MDSNQQRILRHRFTVGFLHPIWILTAYGAASRTRTCNSFLEHPLSKRADYHYHIAADGSGSWVRTNNPLGQNQVLFQLSYTAIWAQAEQGSPARANRGKEENNMARFRGWRQRRASNPQARRPPVFRTDWHSHLPSLPYWKSWTPCAPLYLYYMHFLRFIFSGASRYLF